MCNVYQEEEINITICNPPATIASDAPVPLIVNIADTQTVDIWIFTQGFERANWGSGVDGME